MKYVSFDNAGAAEVLKITEGAIPEVKAGEVLIRVKAAGVNRPDIAQRAGTYPPPPGASPILGLEVAGEVAAVGEGVSDWKIGDAICALTPGGGYAEFCAAPAVQCLPIPKGLSMLEAAGLAENFFTVWSNVFDRGKLKAGENFLVHGGTSGIGLTAIQLAKAFSAKVFTTAGSAKKCEACIQHGADYAINYKEKDFVQELKNLAADQGMNLILSMVGGPYFQKNMDSLALDGRLVQIAVLEGAQTSLNLAQMMSRRLTLSGSTLRPRTLADKEVIAKALLQHVWPLIASGRVKVVIDQIFPLEEVASAHRLMESSQHIGKIILKVTD